jgi:formylglycine-generating enzyme required for sulfatase activity
LLAGQALVESADLDKVSERNRVRLEKVRAHLVRVMKAGELPAVERAAAGRALAKLGDPRPGVGLRSDGLPDIEWCEVPAGPFLSGSDKEKDKSITEPYRISRYPVTNAQFEAFVRAGGYQEERYWREAIEEGYWSDGAVKTRWDDKPYTAPEDYGEPYNLPNHPVVGVTWYESVAFCRWLTTVLREREEIGKDERVSLPSEVQWEKAARGTDGRVYPWGEEPDPERANYDDTGIGATSAVGCFPGGKSPYEVEDASGNVWEWVGDGRVVRGGAFLYTEYSVRCAYRALRPPLYRLNHCGFRGVVSRA